MMNKYSNVIIINNGTILTNETIFKSISDINHISK